MKKAGKFSVILLCLVLTLIGGSISNAAGSWEYLGTYDISAGAVSDLSSFVYDGVPYVAFSDSSNSGKATVMKFNRSQGIWEPVGVPGFTSGGVSSVSLFIYDGVPYIAYNDLSKGTAGKATVKKFNSSTGSWTTLGSAGFSGGRIESASLFIQNNIPYLAFIDTSNYNKAAVMKYSTANGWTMLGLEGPSTGSAAYTSLYIYDNIPYVAFQDLHNNNKATVKKYQDGAWQAIGAEGFTMGTATYNSLKVYNGTPYLAYKDSTHNMAKISWFDGHVWVESAIPYSTNVEYVSLALNGNTPYVSYVDKELSDKITVAKYNGSSWELIGTEGFSSKVENSAVHFSDGKIYTAYIEDTTSKAKVMQYIDYIYSDSIALSNNVIAENSAVQTTIGSLNVNSAGLATTFAYSLTSGTGDMDNSDFIISGNLLKSNKIFDYEVKSNYNIRIRAVSANGQIYEKAFVITVQNINDAPTAFAKTYSTKIGATLYETLSANDFDNNSLTYSIVSYPTKGSVTITNAATGAFAYTPALNASGTDSFTFRVFDGQNYSNIATATIKIGRTVVNTGLSLTIKPEMINLEKSNGKSPIFAVIKLENPNMNLRDIDLDSLSIKVGSTSLSVKKAPKILKFYEGKAYITVMFLRSGIPDNVQLTNGKITFTASLTVNGSTFTASDTVKAKLPKNKEIIKGNAKGNAYGKDRDEEYRCNCSYCNCEYCEDCEEDCDCEFCEDYCEDHSEHDDD